jgi:hypothetical protein
MIFVCGKQEDSTENSSYKTDVTGFFILFILWGMYERIMQGEVPVMADRRQESSLFLMFR